MGKGVVMIQTAAVHHRSKVTAAWLACLFGVLGAHWWYMGRRYAWVVTLFSLSLLTLAFFSAVWWNNPAFLLLIIPTADGVIEAVVFALMDDKKFDARYNPRSSQATRTGWHAVLVAIFSTLMGGTVLIFGIALIVIHVYTSMGWLEGHVI